MRDGAAPRVALVLALCLILVAAGCGGGEESGGSTEVDTVALEQEADVEILNEILGRQQAAVAAYEKLQPAMHKERELGLEFRAQEEEHAVAILEALRALGGDEEPPAEEIDVGEPRSEEARLLLFYEMEAATLQAELSAIGRLEGGAARALIATTMANRAQHLLLLRQALGAKPDAWVSAAFENGMTPVP